jgi:hypothetical protein
MQLESLPTWLSDYWGISLEAAQVILSITVLIAILLPVMFFAKGVHAAAIELIFLFLVETLLVGIGWLPSWVMIATIAVMAVAIALLGTRVVSGG